MFLGKKLRAFLIQVSLTNHRLNPSCVLSSAMIKLLAPGLQISAALTVAALTVTVPSSRDLFDDRCAAFRLPPRAVNATFLDQTTLEHPWIEPPFGFGYGKWAMAWTTIELYWEWSNIQVYQAIRVCTPLINH